MKNDFATKADLKKTAEGLHQEISASNNALNQKHDSPIESDTEAFGNSSIPVNDISFQLKDLKNQFREFRKEINRRFDEVMKALENLADLIKKGRAESLAFYESLGRQKIKPVENEKCIETLKRNEG